MKILARLFLALFVALILDIVSKNWMEQTLEPYQPVSIIGDFLRFTLGYNSGVAFGMFANGGLWPLIITGGVIVFLLLWFTKAIYSGHFPAQAVWPVGLLLGGAIGNFIDRLQNGQVTDFIDVGIGTTRWPTFNLADSFILIGVGLLVLITFNHKEDRQNVPQFDPPPPNGEADTFLT